MKHTLSIILFLFATLQSTLAQNQFQYLYQNEASIEVFATPASNGDILLASDSYNDTANFFHRLILQRLDVQGNVLQSTGLFRPPSFRMSGGILATSDNGALLMGTVNIPLEDEDSVFVTKVNDMGQVQWTKGFQVEPNIHAPRGAIETSDGNYLVYGTYEHVNFAEGIFLLKINTFGALIWSRTINSQLSGAFMKVGGVVESTNGDLWLSGSTRFNSEGSWLAKLNSVGETQSVTFYGTHKLTPNQPEPFAIFERANGEKDIFYNSTGFQTGPIMLAIHVDANGMPLKTTRFYNSIHFGEITDIRPTGDGGYVGCGYRFVGNSNRSSGFSMKIKGDYSTEWARSYGTDYIEITNSIFPTSDGGFAIAGFADFDSVIISPSENGLFPWLIKTDGSGWSTCYSKNSSATKKDTTATTMTYQLDNVAGVSLGDIPFSNISVGFIPDSVMCMPTSIEVLPLSSFSLYPNPSQGKFIIEKGNLKIKSIEVFDLMGRRISTVSIQKHDRLEIQTTYKGIGVVKVEIEGEDWSRKIMLR